MGIRVRDIMSRPVVAATTGMSLRQLMDLLRESSISGVPVTDSEMRLVGVISETDLIRLDIPASAESEDRFSLKEGVVSVERSYRIEQLDLPVQDVMSKKVLTIDPDATVRAVCALFSQHGVHRLVVMESGEIAGIVTPVDIVRAVAAGKLALEG